MHCNNNGTRYRGNASPSFSLHDKRHQHHCTLLSQPNSERGQSIGRYFTLSDIDQFPAEIIEKKIEKKDDTLA